MQLPANGTTTWPYDPSLLTVDDAYRRAQTQLWSPYVGLLVNAALITVFLSEVIKYFRYFGRDRAIIKATVVALAAVELTQCIFCFYAGYIVFAKRWGRYPVWNQMIYGNMIPDTVVASMTHALYAWRVYHLFTRGRRRQQWLGGVLAGSISILSVVQLVCCCIAVFYNAMPAHKISPHQMNLGRTFFRVWLVLCIAADVIITVSLSMRLNQCRSGQRSTDSSISRMLWVFLPGGLLTMLATTAALAIEVFAPGEDYYSFLLLCLSKLYGIAIIVCLNLRLQYEVRPNWLPDVLDTASLNGEEAASVMSDSAERFGWLRSNNPCLAHSIAGAGNGVVSVNQQATASNSNLLPMLRGSNSIGAQTQLAQQQGLIHPYHLPSPDGSNVVDTRQVRHSGSTLYEPPSPARTEMKEKGKDRDEVDTERDDDGDVIEKLKHLSASSQDRLDRVREGMATAAHRRSKSLSSASASAPPVPFSARTSSTPSGISPRPLLLVNTAAALYQRRNSIDKRDSDSSPVPRSSPTSNCCGSSVSSASSYRTPSPTASPGASTAQHGSGGVLLPYIAGDRTRAPSLAFTPIDVDGTAMSPDTGNSSPTSKRSRRHGRIFECIKQDQLPPETTADTSSERNVPSRHTFGRRRGEITNSQLSSQHHQHENSLTSTVTVESSSTTATTQALDIEEADVTSHPSIHDEVSPQVAPLTLLAATSYCQSSDLAGVQHANSLGYCSMFSAAMPTRPPRRHKSNLHRRSTNGSSSGSGSGSGTGKMI